jgi:hypothetical protein
MSPKHLLPCHLPALAGYSAPPLSPFPPRSLLVKTSLLPNLPAPSKRPPLPSCPPTPSFTPSWTASTFLSPVILVLERLSTQKRVLAKGRDEKGGLSCSGPECSKIFLESAVRRACANYTHEQARAVQKTLLWPRGAISRDIEH